MMDRLLTLDDFKDLLKTFNIKYTFQRVSPIENWKEKSFHASYEIIVEEEYVNSVEKILYDFKPVGYPIFVYSYDYMRKNSKMTWE